MADKKDTNENPWGDEQWGDFNDENDKHGKNKQQQKPDDVHDHQQKAKEGKKLTEMIGDGLHKTKEGASRSMKRVKDGASVGLFWMKDKLRRPAAQKPPPPPPPLSNSSP